LDIELQLQSKGKSMAEWSEDKARGILKALLRQAESELALGNSGANALFLNQAEKIATKYGIDLSTIDTAFESDAVKVLNELGSTSISNIFNRVNAKTNLRKLWFEELAKVVGEGYGCKVAPNINDGSAVFYGYDLDREVATFMFVKLAEVANELCLREMSLAKKNVGKGQGFDFKTKKHFKHPDTWMENDVWIDNFHKGYREEIAKFLSNRQVDSEKLAKVEDYFNKNKDENSYNYWHNYRRNTVHESAHNEQAFQVGRICGYNIAHKASTSPSALTVKKSIISTKNKVIVLVDNSTSMDWWGGEKSPIAQAREGTIEYVKSALEKKFQVDVIAFSDKAIPVVTNIEEYTPDVEEKIKSISTVGGTNLTDALKLAQSKFLNRNVERVIMVVTDGMPNDETSALRIANDCKRLDIRIFAIGCGQVRQEFLDKLTSPGMNLLVDSSRLMLGMGELAARL
jgi:Mg-chelatase subunit ChlD